MTLREIAAIAHVSPASVSLVLNNKPGVGDAKRQEIQALLQKYQYGVPKAGVAAARQLLFLKYMRNGLVVEKNTGFVASILDAIEAECRSLQYTLRIEVCRENLADYIQQADFSQLDGVFVLGTELGADEYPVLERIPLPYVVLDNRMPDHPCVSITMNNHEMVHIAIRHAFSLGYRRIGYLKSSMHIQNFDDRSEAFFEEVRSLSMECGNNDVFELDPSPMGAYTDMSNFLKNGRTLPPCVFADNDTIALGAMRAFSESGIRVPENISIIGFDDISFSAMNGLSTMHVSTDRLGRMAVRIMDHVLHSEDLRDCKLLMGGRLVPRQSTVPYMS